MPYSYDLNYGLRKSYYKSVLNFIRLVSVPSDQSEFDNYAAFRLPKASVAVRNILVHRSIVENSLKAGDDFERFQPEDREMDDVYIDVDGIGLQLRPWRNLTLPRLRYRSVASASNSPYCVRLHNRFTRLVPG